jgi:membrane protein DedA with SNARE-associated domain
MADGPQTPDAVADEPEMRRIPLPILLTPLSLGVLAGFVSLFTWVYLSTHHPLALLALNPINRYLLLTAPQLTFATFFTVAFVRLLATDPFAYVLGRQYGDAAKEWIEKGAGGSQGRLLVTAERWFAKAAPLVILLAPSPLWCTMAGVTKMRPLVFAVCNVVGTIGRLLLFWWAAEAFKEPLEDVLDFIERFQMPLLVAAVGFGVWQVNRSRRDGSLASPAEMEADLLEHVESENE